jgi:hypothetical protein
LVIYFPLKILASKSVRDKKPARGQSGSTLGTPHPNGLKATKGQEPDADFSPEPEDKYMKILGIKSGEQMSKEDAKIVKERKYSP